MIILASDTSTKTLSVAICREGALLAGVTEQTGTTHCQTHMPVIQRLLAQAGLHFGDIDLYACTIGPGSYTGIRIGVSTTKAMAYASDKPAIGVSTLETLAKPHQRTDRMICPVLDARNRRIFSSGYRSDGRIIPEANRSIEEFLNLITGILEAGPVSELVFCGDAALLFKEDPFVKNQMESLSTAGFVNAATYLATVPEASDVADIARRMLLEGKKSNDSSFSPGENESRPYFIEKKNAGDPFTLEANYLSPSQAERIKKAAAQVPHAGCSIRAASLPDLPDIRSLEQECFAIPWSLQSLETDLTENRNVATYLVALEAGRVTGYIGMWMVLDEAQVTNLAVTSAFRRKGTGQRLIQALADIARERGAVQLTLEVRASNAPARRVYERCGFFEIASRKAYYEDNGEDAIIMLKKFSTDPA